MAKENKGTGRKTEAEFLDVIGTKVLRVFLLAIFQSLLPTDFILEQKWFGKM
jgi:hypothetical protein